MTFFMIACRRASELVEMSQETKLTFLQRFQLWMHTLLCKGCRAYQKQSRLIEKFLEKNIDLEPPTKPEVDTDDLQKRIIEKLEGR